jgi:hypothetical protein
LGFSRILTVWIAGLSGRVLAGYAIYFGSGFGYLFVKGTVTRQVLVVASGGSSLVKVALLLGFGFGWLRYIRVFETGKPKLFGGFWVSYFGFG